jgi:hypothetical protein
MPASPYGAPMMFDLPQGANINLLTQPLQQGLQAYRQGMDKQFQGERELKQEQQADERLNIAKQAAARADEKAQVDKIAGVAQQIDGLPDSPQKRVMWSNLVKSHPNFSNALTGYGVSPDDHVNGPKFIIAQARGYVDPTEQATAQARLKLIQAQTAAANRREDPDVVRTLRAAGIDPQSEQGRQMILNSVKGGDPISQAVGAAIQGQFSPPQAAPRASPIRPQSYAPPEAEPQNLLIPTQAAEPAPQVAPLPAQAAQPDIVDTPIGKMPRDKARLLGFGIAMSGKGEAGKMFLGEDKTNLGKEGMNNVEKEIIGRVQDLGELTDIKNQFDPKFLDLGYRIKQAGVGVQAWLNAKSVKPEDRDNYKNYTAFRASVTERLNNRIKLMSGTAVSGAEEQRMLRANPNAGTSIADGDDPIAFEAKLNNAIKMQKLAVARFNYLRSKGIDETQIGQLAKAGKIEGVAGLDGMTKIMNDRGAKLEQQLRQANPQADDTVIRGAVKQQLKQEFGI